MNTTAIVLYAVTLLLLVFNLLCFHVKNRVTIIGRCILFFTPLVGLAFELITLIIKFVDYSSSYGTEPGLLNNNKLIRWLFNDASETTFYDKSNK